jgi:hypothetical protein
MSYLPIHAYRPRRATLSRIAGALLVALSALTASAQLPSFTLSNNGPIKIASNHYGPVTVTVTPVGGFSGTVLLTCNNMPVHASCKFPNLDQVVPVSGGPASLTFTINTTEVDQYNAKLAPVKLGKRQIALATLFAPALCLLFFARRKSARSGLTRLMLFVLALLPLSALAGCAAVYPPSTPPGSYSVIINGNAGPQNIPTVITLVVT